jgi:hypothetical protein
MAPLAHHGAIPAYPKLDALAAVAGARGKNGWGRNVLSGLEGLNVTLLALCPSFRSRGSRRAIEFVAAPLDVPAIGPQTLGELGQILGGHY